MTLQNAEPWRSLTQLSDFVLSLCCSPPLSPLLVQDPVWKQLQGYCDGSTPPENYC